MLPDPLVARCDHVTQFRLMRVKWTSAASYCFSSFLFGLYKIFDAQHPLARKQNRTANELVSSYCMCVLGFLGKNVYIFVFLLFYYTKLSTPYILFCGLQFHSSLVHRDLFLFNGYVVFHSVNFKIKPQI